MAAGGGQEGTLFFQVDGARTTVRTGTVTLYDAYLIQVEAGSYALSARKAAKGWQLTLHTGAGFSRPGDDAIAMQTEFVDKTLLFEHLNCDIQPGGDKKSTKLFLDVRFDTMLARVLIEIPE